jgi:enoyl-CoA hydratase/carnithine racemase
LRGRSACGRRSPRHISALSGEDAALAALPAEFRRILPSEDATEGLRAQQEGRPPVFRDL